MYSFYQSHIEDYYVHTTIDNCYPSHLHKQVELFYVKEGSINICINGSERTLQPGDLSICFPNMIHSTKTIEHSVAELILISPDILIDFASTFTKFYPESPFIQTKNATTAIDSTSLTKITCITKEEVEFLLLQLQILYNQNVDFRIVKGYLYLLFGKLISSLTLLSNTNVDYTDTCRNILSYVNENYTRNISLDTLSNDLNISKFYISHIFSDKIKMSFPDYLNRCRTDYAKNLLISTSMNITEIGFECGFNNIRSFNRAFKKFYKITPIEFRKSSPLPHI